MKMLVALMIVSVVMIQSTNPLQAGWFEKSTATDVYAKPGKGKIGIVVNGITYGADLILSTDYQYSILHCSGFAIHCSYSKPVVIREE